jgi:hypothetical protein
VLLLLILEPKLAAASDDGYLDKSFKPTKILLSTGVQGGVIRLRRRRNQQQAQNPLRRGHALACCAELVLRLTTPWRVGLRELIRV